MSIEIIYDFTLIYSKKRNILRFRKLCIIWNEIYYATGSDEEGDYSLQIYPVNLDDNAQFQCQVSPGPHGEQVFWVFFSFGSDCFNSDSILSGHPGVRSRYATLSVLVAPDAPVITQGSNLVTTEGREIRLECISANGRPAAEVSYLP